MKSLSQLIRATALFGIAAVARAVLAADLNTYPIDIPAQNLGTALLKFATTIHAQITFDYKSVEGYRSTALAGTYTIEEGLHTLIGTAPFLAGATPSGVLTVSASPAPLVGADTRTPDQSSMPSAGASPDGSSALTSPTSSETVTVRARRRAQRAELGPKVTRFVYGMVDAENGDDISHGGQGLARWVKPVSVCPLVSGVPKEVGEFILARVSEIARAAAAPLATQRCWPTLYILVTTQPKELLKGMGKRNYPRTFGSAPPSIVDEFIETPRTARVWYNFPSPLGTAGGSDPGASLNTGTFVTGRNLAPEGAGGGSQSSQPGNLVSAPSNPGPDESRFWYVYIVIDQTRLQGVSWEQLADYAAMVGLARIKPTARVRDAPTILTLFAGAPQAAPAGLTDWDRAFLKSLYATDPQPFVRQRSLIAERMVREIVP